MKVLLVATVRSHIGQFHVPLIKALKERGWTVDAAYHDNSADKPGMDLSALDAVYEVPFDRSPLKIKNLKSYHILKQIIDSGNYDVIHCNTPVGAVVARLAARKARKHGTKVVYTAHGFHFYKGASLKNWLLFYPIEKYLAGFTDLLITINQEDYNLATERKFKAKRIEKVNGVGVDFSRFSIVTADERNKLRSKYNYSDSQFIMLYAADLSIRKNQQMLLKSVAELKNQIPDLLLLLPGQPILKEQYEKLCSELGISDNVLFLGYRRDIDKLLALCDCVVSSSKQEGLPLNLIEAAARGKYIIATDVRGNADVVNQSGFGTLVDLNDIDAFSNEILKFYKTRGQNHDHTKLNDIGVYEQSNVIKELMKLYNDVCYEKK